MSELIDLDNVVESGDPNYELVTFSWDLLDVCQYNCSYCSAMNFNLATFAKHPQAKEAWLHVIKMLSLPTIRTPFCVEILGGEPTLHPNIKDIITQLCSIENCISVSLITNLAKSLKFYKELDIESNNKLTIEASYHPEYSNQPYFDKLVELNKSDHISIIPNINLPSNPEHWERTKKLIDGLVDLNLPVGLNLLQSVPDGDVGGFTPTYTEDFWDYFKDYYVSENIYQVNGDIKSPLNRMHDFLKEHAGSFTSNISYITKDGKKHLYNEADINKHNLRHFTGWKCKALMYHIDMYGLVTNHCDRTPVKFLTTNNLTKCRTCVIDHCDCDTKFMYHKTNPDHE
jgi:MoaA/NifB/PqqE/SkfB family radical SAM enzyme